MDIKTNKEKDRTEPKIETKEEYFARIEKALKNLEEGNGISLSETELDNHFQEVK